MRRKEIGESVKKNILDLQYNKYLQYYNTSVIVLFTYFIGIGVALITEQVDFREGKQLLLLVF